MFIPLTIIGQLGTLIEDLIICSPALAGRCGNPGDTILRWRAGCCGDRRWASVSDGDATSEVVTSALPGLLNCSGLWLDDWTVTGMEKVCGAAVDCCKMEQDLSLYCVTVTHLFTAVSYLVPLNTKMCVGLIQHMYNRKTLMIQAINIYSKS